MKISSWLLLGLVSLLGSCVTAFNWQEVQSGPATRAEVYDAVVFVARGDGFLPGSNCDRGMGIWESKWRYRQLGLGRPGRYRLRAELLIDDGSRETGWAVRFKIEQEKVDDLRKSLDPREQDWESDGQDYEREALFVERLRLRLGMWTLESKSQ